MKRSKGEALVREERRSPYYVEGSTVYRAAEPARKQDRRKTAVKKKAPRLVTYPKAAVKAENSLFFDKGYAVVVLIAALIIIASLAVMVRLQGKVDDQERNIRILRSELSDIQADNVAFEDSLDSKYSLDYIYQVATKDLGMVYSQKGQIVYYDRAREDYVKQMHDVPEAN
ncbi:MAG: hypothetical protein J6O53_04915 [Eubacterium sp.]|nr:hypothetical protein [Eubacterium sp.]